MTFDNYQVFNLNKSLSLLRNQWFNLTTDFTLNMMKHDNHFNKISRAKEKNVKVGLAPVKRESTFLSYTTAFCNNYPLKYFTVNAIMVYQLITQLIH